MMTPDTAHALDNAARQAGVKILIIDGMIDDAALEYAKNAFVTQGASFTIRNGQVTGRQNFDLRMRNAITAYLRQAAQGGDA